MARSLKVNIGVVGEGITEKYYFTHLRKIKGYKIKIKPGGFVKGKNIEYLNKKVKEFLSADMIVICVFDADVSQKNNKEKEKLTKFIKTYMDNNNVIICDSLPSIEFWFLLHFRKTNKYFPNYNSIRNELRKYIPGYDKTEKYLLQDQWVKVLIGKQDIAINNGKKIVPGEGSYSIIYKAIELLEKTNR